MLPITEIPSSSMTLPVTKKDITVRAMTTKEEKILLLGKECGDDAHVSMILNNLIKECTYSKITSFDNLSTPDIIAILLKIIELSRGSIVEHTYICKNLDKDNKVCNTKIVVPVDIKDVKYNVHENINDTKSISDSVSVKLVYPSKQIYDNAKNDSDGSDIDLKLHLCAYCIELVLEGEEVYNEYSHTEIYEWLLNFPSSIIKKISDYISSAPSAILEYDVKCPKCGYSQHIILNEITDFFMNDI